MAQESPAQSNEPLSERELEILKLVATGASNKQIASALSISPNTVKVHLRNVFGKIGANSRTEASMIAIRGGWVDIPSQFNEIESSIPDVDLDEALEVGSVSNSVDAESPNEIPNLEPGRKWLVSAGILVIISIIGFIILRAAIPTQSNQNDLPTPDNQVVSTPQWLFENVLKTARTSLAVAVYRGNIYIIGGASDSNVPLSTVEIYNPETNTWSTGQDKPIPTSKVSAVTIGGLIFVPGGETANHKPSNILEAYNPESDSWENRSTLPYSVASYAIAAYEGKMYVFGGWDGQKHLTNVLEYDPETDEWVVISNLPEPRSNAAATSTDEAIYVIGGENENGPLASVLKYFPNQSSSNHEETWGQHIPLPEPRAGVGATSTSSIILVVGGTNDYQTPLPSLILFPQDEEWQELALPAEIWGNMGVGMSQTTLYAFGGSINGIPTDKMLRYQVLYTIAIPYVR